MVPRSSPLLKHYFFRRSKFEALARTISKRRDAKGGGEEHGTNDGKLKWTSLFPPPLAYFFRRSKFEALARTISERRDAKGGGKSVVPMMEN